MIAAPAEPIIHAQETLSPQEYRGDVHIWDQSLRIQAAKATLTQKEHGNTSRILAEGDVHLSHPTIFARADRAVVHRASHIIELHGTTRLWANGHQMQAESARWNLDSGEIHIQQARGELPLALDAHPGKRPPVRTTHKNTRRTQEHKR